MSEDNKQAVSLYPPPPALYKLYGPRDARDTGAAAGPSGRPLAPPRPPKIPPPGQPLLQFGVPQGHDPMLPTDQMDVHLGVRKAFREDPKTLRGIKAGLEALSSELLLALMELLDTSIWRPGELGGRDPVAVWGRDLPEALKDVDAVAKNIIHLTNLARRHQASGPLLMWTRRLSALPFA